MFKVRNSVFTGVKISWDQKSLNAYEKILKYIKF